MKHIVEIARKAGIGEQYVIPYGNDKAKISSDILEEVKNNPMGILTVVKFTNVESGYKCLICRDGEDRDFSSKFNSYLNSVSNENQ